MTKDNFWFTHDLNARNDRKIGSLVKDHKSSGYGIFWCAVEMMHEEGGKLEFDEITISAIAKDLNESTELISTVIQDCISRYKLFSVVDNSLVSNRVERNMVRRTEQKEKKSKAGKASAEKRKHSTDDEQNSTSVEQVLTSVEQKATEERRGEDNIVSMNKKDNDSSIGNVSKEEDKTLTKVKEASEKKTGIDELAWDNKPNGKQLDLPLPQIKIGAIIELFKTSKNSDITSDQVLSLWKIFKIQNFDGVNFYNNEGKVYSHFINWANKPSVTINTIQNGTNKRNGSYQHSTKPVAENKSNRRLGDV